MGMFDDINYECDCPVCGVKVNGFQSKDGDCVLDTIDPADVNRFYSACGGCKAWITFEKIPTPNYVMLVSRWTGGEREEMPELTKEVYI